MANIIDYVKWRGDLELKVSEFNEIDSLILNRFSYFPLDSIMKENEIVSIKELSERFEKEDKNKMEILWKDDADLFPIMGKSKRFGEMIALEYINKIEPETEKQFSTKEVDELKQKMNVVEFILNSKNYIEQNIDYKVTRIIDKELDI